MVGFSEVDQYALALLKYRFPEVKNYGDITLIDAEKLPDFDVLVGGSPCQDLSVSKNNREGLTGEKSELFFEYVRILRIKKPAFFVLENVASMKNDDKDFISETVGVEPIKINSAAFTAQDRKRLYWTNIPNVKPPTSLGLLLDDILEKNVDERYFVDRQNRKGKMIHLTGEEQPPAVLKEVRTELGKAERKRNQFLLGIDRHSRNKTNSKYIAVHSKKSNCLQCSVYNLQLLVVQKEN